jgi:hypothetical protein
LLVVAVVLSQTVRLILIAGRYFFRAYTNSQHTRYQPLLNPSEESRTVLN